MDTPIILALNAIVFTSSQFLQTPTSSVSDLNCGMETIGIKTWERYIIEIMKNITNTTITSQELPELQTNSTCLVGYKDEQTNIAVFNAAAVIIGVSYFIRYFYLVLNYIFSDKHFTSNQKDIVSQLRYLLLYIQGYNNQKISKEFKRYSPSYLTKILNDNYRFSSVYHEMKTHFEKNSTLFKD